MSEQSVSRSEERRGAVWLMHWLRGDFAAARILEEEGRIAPLSVYRAAAAAAPELRTHPNQCADRLAFALASFTHEVYRHAGWWLAHTLRSDHATAERAQADGPVEAPEVVAMLHLASPQFARNADGCDDRLAAYVCQLIKLEHDIDTDAEG